MASLLILGAGYLGAAAAELALARGDRVTLADNWLTTERAQLDGLAAAGAEVHTADIRSRDEIDALLAQAPDRVLLLAAQASRPLSERDPELTEDINILGVRRVAQAIGAVGDTAPAVVFASSLHVYGPRPSGDVGPDHPYGDQGDLAHLSKIYGELCLRMHAHRHGFGLSVLRVGIVFGAGPVVHSAPESVTVVDTFRKRVAAGETLRIDDPHATIGVVHVSDVGRILADEAPARGELRTANVAAETVTVGEVAALARGQHAPGRAPCRYLSHFTYEHALRDYLRP